MFGNIRNAQPLTDMMKLLLRINHHNRHRHPRALHTLHPHPALQFRTLLPMIPISRPNPTETLYLPHPPNSNYINIEYTIDYSGINIEKRQSIYRKKSHDFVGEIRTTCGG